MMPPRHEQLLATIWMTLERIEKLCSPDYHYQTNKGRAQREADRERTP